MSNKHWDEVAIARAQRQRELPDRTNGLPDQCEQFFGWLKSEKRIDNGQYSVLTPWQRVGLLREFGASLPKEENQ
ncbi:MAG: hypothetical protein ACTS2F_27595 [Thainema sp.]